MKTLQFIGNKIILPPYFVMLICLMLQSFMLAPEAIRQGDIQKFNYKEHTFIIRESGGKSQLSLKKGVAEKEIKKPKVTYRNENGLKLTEYFRNPTTMFILQGSDEDLIWMFGEGPNGSDPSFSGFYDFSGNVISYSFSVRLSSQKAQLLNRDGDLQSTLEGYCIDNFDEQINNPETFQKQIGLW